MWTTTMVVVWNNKPPAETHNPEQLFPLVKQLSWWETLWCWHGELQSAPVRLLSAEYEDDNHLCLLLKRWVMKSRMFLTKHGCGWSRCTYLYLNKAAVIFAGIQTSVSALRYNHMIVIFHNLPVIFISLNGGELLTLNFVWLWDSALEQSQKDCCQKPRQEKKSTYF